MTTGGGAGFVNSSMRSSIYVVCLSLLFQEENPLNIPFPPLLDETEKSSKGSKSRKSSKRVKEGNAAVVTEPKYSVVHRGEFSMQDYTNERCSSLVRRPKELVVEVQLPGVSSVANLEVDIFKERVKLHCKSPCYDLDVSSGN